MSVKEQYPQGINARLLACQGSCATELRGMKWARKNNFNRWKSTNILEESRQYTPAWGPVTTSLKGLPGPILTTWMSATTSAHSFWLSRIEFGPWTKRETRMHHWHLIPLIKYTLDYLCQLPQGYSDVLLINSRGGVRRLGPMSSSPKLAKGFDLICLRPEGIGLESRSLYKWEHALPELQPWRPLERAFLGGGRWG